MKRLGVLLLIIAMSLFLGCENKESISIGESITDVLDRYESDYFMPPVCVFETEDMYTLVLTDGEAVNSIVTFSNDRHVVRNENLELVTIKDCYSLLGSSAEEIEQLYGPAHCTVGTGISTPSYITVDGYLIMMFYNIDENVFRVVRIDLFGSAADKPVEDFYLPQEALGRTR